MALITPITSDSVPTVLDDLAGVFVDGTDPADIAEHGMRLIERVERLEFVATGANSDLDTEAWLAGQEV